MRTQRETASSKKKRKRKEGDGPPVVLCFFRCRVPSPLARTSLMADVSGTVIVARAPPVGARTTKVLLMARSGRANNEGQATDEVRVTFHSVTCCLLPVLPHSHNYSAELSVVYFHAFNHLA